MHGRGGGGVADAGGQQAHADHGVDQVAQAWQGEPLGGREQLAGAGKVQPGGDHRQGAQGDGERQVQPQQPGQQRQQPQQRVQRQVLVVHAGPQPRPGRQARKARRASRSQQQQRQAGHAGGQPQRGGGAAEHQLVLIGRAPFGFGSPAGAPA